MKCVYFNVRITKVIIINQATNHIVIDLKILKQINEQKHP